MNNLDEKFNQISNSAKNISLSDKEKEEIKQRLFRFMKETDVSAPQPKQGWPATLAGYFAQNKTTRYSIVSLASFLGVMLFSGSVAFASQNALPGELLYPVKTGITEKVLGWSKGSDQEKANYAIGLVQLRLEEMEKVSAKAEVSEQATDQVQNLINQHVSDVKSRIENIRKQGQQDAAIEANSDLEASLSAHTDLLQRIQAKGNAKKSAASAKIDNFILNLKEKTGQSIKDRQSEESNLAAQPAVGLKIAAEHKLAKAAIEMKEVTDLLATKKGLISTSSYQNSVADLDVATQSFTEGSEKMAEQDYKSAFVFFQGTVRTLLQIRIFVTGESKLEVKLDSPSSNGPAQQDGVGSVIDSQVNLHLPK